MADADILTTPARKGDDDLVVIGTSAPGNPKMHAKCLTLLVSAGTDDSDRDIEEFLADIKTALQTVARTKRVTASSIYYVIDGKVCLPADYNKATKNFKKGATPPPWAGGPAPASQKRDTVAASRPARKESSKTPTEVESKVDDALSNALDAVKAAKENPNE